MLTEKAHTDWEGAYWTRTNHWVPSSTLLRPSFIGKKGDGERKKEYGRLYLVLECINNLLTAASPCATLVSVTLFLETKLKNPEIKHFELLLTQMKSLKCYESISFQIKIKIDDLDILFQQIVKFMFCSDNTIFLFTRTTILVQTTISYRNCWTMVLQTHIHISVVVLR